MNPSLSFSRLLRKYRRCFVLIGISFKCLVNVFGSVLLRTLHQHADNFRAALVYKRYMILLESQRFMCEEITRDEYSSNSISSSCRCNPTEMSTVGHAAFAVCKVKENRERALQKMQSVEGDRNPYNVNYNMEYTPMKYSSKLMNSIWGMYNRYSVHNLKRIMDEVPSVAVSQQASVGNSATLDRSAASTKTGTGPAKNLMQNWFSHNDYSY